MTSKKWPTILIMIIAVTSVTIGDLFMSKAMRGLGPLRLANLSAWWNGEAALSAVLWDVYELGWLIFTQPMVWIAIGFMLGFLILWMVALSWSDLTFVMPLTALTYVMNAILVGPALGEEVSGLRWAGTLLITLGVGVVSADVDSKDLPEEPTTDDTGKT